MSVETEYTVNFKDVWTGRMLAPMRFGSLGELFRFNADRRGELVQVSMTSRTYSVGHGVFYKV